MKEITFYNLFSDILKERNIIDAIVERYNYFRNNRFFLGGSVNDFVENSRIKTPLSDLFFLSDPEWRLIALERIYLERLENNNYSKTLKIGKHFFIPYKIFDETGGIISFWPVEKNLCNISCDYFEQIKIPDKKVEGILLKFNRRTGDNFIQRIDYYCPPGKETLPGELVFKEA